MRRLKGFKMMLMAFAVCCLFGMTSQEVFAKSVSEKEGNETQETAMEIEANEQTAVNAANGKSSTLYHVDGTVYSDEQDWYKVYLTKGEQYVSLNGDAVDVVVWTENGKMVLDESYIKTSFGFSGFPFDAESAGYYYVQITTTRSYASYILSVGDPNYSAAECTVKLGSVTMSSRQNSVEFDLRKADMLPEGAVVYSILMDGLNSQTVSAVDVTNVSAGKKINLGVYTWSKDRLEFSNLLLKSKWKVTFTRKEYVSFTPSIKLYYVYPITSTTVEDNITFS